MELKTRAHLLALDLDHVLAGEADDGSGRGIRIFGIHSELAKKIGTVNAQRTIVTHRSRQEAVRILSALGIDPDLVAETFAAEDLFRAAVLNRNLTRLFRDGLRKSYILPQICRRYKVPPGRIAFVDDRVENVHDMLSAGVGLGLVAPWRQIEDNTYLSFDFDTLVATVNDWIRCNSREPQASCLKYLEVSTRELAAAGGGVAIDGALDSGVFNFCRRTVKAGRGLFKGRHRDVSI